MIIGRTANIDCSLLHKCAKPQVHVQVKVVSTKSLPVTVKSMGSAIAA